MAEGWGTKVLSLAPVPDTLCDLGPVPLPPCPQALFSMHPNSRAGSLSTAVGTHPGGGGREHLKSTCPPGGWRQLSAQPWKTALAGNLQGGSRAWGCPGLPTPWPLPGPPAGVLPHPSPPSHQE